MQVFFDDLALPNLIRTTLADAPEYKTHRAGFSSDGTPNNLHIVRSMRGAIGRRIALGSESRRELTRLEGLLEVLLAPGRRRRRAGMRSKPWSVTSKRCARTCCAFPTSTRSICAIAAACARRCRPRGRSCSV
jgi:hypothetical protein